MSEQSAAAGLPALLRLDQVGTDRWCSAAQSVQSVPGEPLGLLGARAMVAAGHTVDTDWRWVHSVHLSQLAVSPENNAGNNAPDTGYRVERLRDDAHLSTRLVHVTAGDTALAAVTVSFQVPRRGTGPSYQAAEPPELPDPHGLPSAGPAGPIDVRHLGPGRRRSWLRVTEELPDRILAHTAALALATDLVLPPPDAAGYRDLDTGHPLRPVVVDRVLRVHRSFRADDWVLYEHESPSASDYRTYATGRFYSSMGRLIASVDEQAVLVPDPVAEAVGDTPMAVGARKGA